MNNTIQMYDAQADTIEIEDVANNSNNRLILSRIKRNSADDSHQLCINVDRYDKKKCYYSPEGAEDMGWLGYFVANNKHLRVLTINQEFDAAIYEPFFIGLGHNTSISMLYLERIDQLDGNILTMLCPFFKCNPNLRTIRITNCNLEEKQERLLALAIGSSPHKSLQDVSLYESYISDKGLVDVITALSFHPHLKDLDLDSNYLQLNGCRALALLLKHSATELQHLDLSRNGIDNEGIEALIPALKNCSHLETLKLYEVGYITSRVWQQLASVLETPNSNMTELSINWNDNVDGLALAAFTRSLVNNNTLQTLNLSGSLGTIQQSEWQAVSKLLCNTSSINSTYLSNHTLGYMASDDSDIHDLMTHDDPTNPLYSIAVAIDTLLTLNQRRNKKEVAMIKVLQHYNGFNMTPLFEWEFKVLPLVIDWFQRASTITMPDNFEANIGPRKLSCIYQFVRAMPELYVETRLRKQLEDVKSKESEIEKRQMDLRRQKLMLDLQMKEVEDEKKSVEDEKKSIMEKLGNKSRKYSLGRIGANEEGGWFQSKRILNKSRKYSTSSDDSDDSLLSQSDN